MRDRLRSCLKCGASQKNDPNMKLYRFPNPGIYNLLKCKLWTRFVFPNNLNNSIDLCRKLYNSKRMLCLKHFNRKFIMDNYKLQKNAVPDIEYSNRRKTVNIVKTKQNKTPETRIVHGKESIEETMLDSTIDLEELPTLENVEGNTDPLQLDLDCEIKSEVSDYQDEEWLEDVDCDQVDETIHRPVQAKTLPNKVTCLQQKFKSLLRTNKFCTLCLDTDKSLKLLNEKITIPFENWTETVDCKHLYSYVFNQEESIGGSICIDCLEKLKESYTFIKHSKFTTQIFQSYINKLKLDKQQSRDDEKLTPTNDTVDKNSSKEDDKEPTNVEKEKSEKSNTGCHIYCKCPKYIKFPSSNNDKSKTDPKKAPQEDEKTVEILQEDEVGFISDDMSEIKPSKTNPKEKVKRRVKMFHKRTASKPVDKVDIMTCTICSKEFGSHLRRHYVIVHSKVLCSICREVSAEEDFEQHLKEHKEKVCFCDFCSRPFYYPESLAVHIKVVHENYDLGECLLCECGYNDHEQHRSYCWCPECEQISCSTHRIYLNSYLEQILNNTYARVKCPQCDYATRKKNNLLRHANKEHLHLSQICDQCAMEFYDKASLATHVRDYHTNLPFCKYCDRRIDSTADFLAGHEAVCKEKKRENRCDQCVASFDTAKQLRRHNNFRHNQVYPCKYCNKVFTRASRLSLHTIRTHKVQASQKKSAKLKTIYVCKICHEVFNMATEMNDHMNAHKGPNGRYTCHDCNTEFEDMEALIEHNEMTHKDTLDESKEYGKQVIQLIQKKESEEMKLIMCDVCGESFADILQFNHHKQVHKYFECDQCDYKAKKKVQVDAHVNKVHAQVKPYVCHKCGQQFYGKYSLATHLPDCQIRSVLRCSMCNREFVSKNGLIRHEATHTGNFSCNICGLKCDSTDTLHAHLMENHSQDRGRIKNP